MCVQCWQDLLAITDRLMADVSRSTIAEYGELCAMTVLKTEMHKSLALCSVFGDFCLLYAA